MMRITLIHIGLPKTATTSLQNDWRKDNRICISYHGMVPCIEEIRSFHRVQPSERAPGKIKAQISLDSKPEPGQHVVLTHEALSTSFVNERACKNQIHGYQATAAKVLSQMVPPSGSKVLLIIREPVGWIKSMYIQCIKQGGIDTFSSFLRGERDFILQSFDISHLITSWSQNFGKKNVLVLPMELYRDDPEKFHHIIHKFSGLPIPPAQQKNRKANVAFNDQEMNLMRIFNMWMEAFLRNGQMVNKHNLSPDLQKALQLVRFAVRYNLEESSRVIDRLTARAQPYLAPCFSENYKICPTLLTEIRSGLHQAIGSSDFYGYRQQYIDN